MAQFGNSKENYRGETHLRIDDDSPSSASGSALDCPEGQCFRVLPSGGKHGRRNWSEPTKFIWLILRRYGFRKCHVLMFGLSVSRNVIQLFWPICILWRFEKFNIIFFRPLCKHILLLYFDADFGSDNRQTCLDYRK